MNFLKYCGISLSGALLCGALLSGCDEAIDVYGSSDNDRYGNLDKVAGYVNDALTGKNSGTLEVFDGQPGETELCVMLTSAEPAAVDASLSVDTEVLAAYNEAHGTSYELWPNLEKVTFEDGGAVVITPGDKRSRNIRVRVEKPAELTAGTDYALPVRLDMKTEGVETLRSGEPYMLFVRVKDGSAAADTKKGEVELIAVLEVNDTNPLNALSLKTKKSGKPLFDYVVLFSSNIVYDRTALRCKVFHNENVQFLLDNHDRFIKPLQDVGIKVVLSIMPNHDPASLMRMDDDMCREFARELKTICDTYGFAGVYFDEEYAGDYEQLPGISENTGVSRAARLFYETKRLMPDRKIMVYGFSGLKYMNTPACFVEDMDPGEYIDVVTPDYGATVKLEDFTGITLSRLSAPSIRMVDGYGTPIQTTTAEKMREVKNYGYGYQMAYNFNPDKRMDFDKNLVTMNEIAQGLYDDELDFSGYWYRKNQTAQTKY